MKIKFFTRLLAMTACCLVTRLGAQPAPCVNPAMTSTCAPACIICDIDGFTGINNSNVQGQAPPGFCTTVVHHMQWIAFIAGTPNIKIGVDIFNCQSNQGLEIGIYQSLNCQNFTLVSNCNTDAGPNATAIFTNTVPLTVGQYYYFVMDGSAGDVCSYTIHVLEGSTEVSPLSTSGLITGPDSGCSGTTAEYLADTIVGATQYKWTLNSTVIGTGQSIDIDWANTGTYQLCVTASNVCDVASPSCKTIVIADIPPTVINGSICAGDCFDVADTTLCNAGDYEFHYLMPNGCDSIVQVHLTIQPQVETDISFNICEGDSVFVGTSYFSLPGQFDEVLTSVNGCDSIIHLTLGNIICEIQGTVQTSPVRCYGERTGSLDFAITNGTPPFTYTWERVGGQPSGNGSLANANQNITLPGLGAGVYLITVADMFGNDVVLIGEVPEPTALSAEAVVATHNGFNVSCNGGNDGTIEIQAQGGVPGYTFAWNTGANQATLTGLPAGAYAVTVTDTRGCTFTVDQTLTQPVVLAMAATFTDPNCDGFDTGSIQISSATGGVVPYEYELSGGGFGDIVDFTGLSEGAYTASVQDANGCITNTDGMLTAPAIPIIEAGEDVLLPLAESTHLHVVANLIPTTIEWAQTPGLSCYDCLDPTAMPFKTTTYTVTVTSEDGCVTSDSLLVRVLKIRDVYIPNAFSPNSDGINDLFSIFTGPEVTNIKSFKVFSRWGELVFEQNDGTPNSSELGWDGKFRGKPMPDGVYVYIADLEFVDDETVRYEGSVTMVQ